MSPTPERIQRRLTCFLCGGSCCRHNPGRYSPRDFGDTKNEIIQNTAREVLSGKAVVTMSDRILSVRPTGGHDSLTEADDSAGGKCIHLGMLGCRLSLEKRPAECAALIPKPRNCGEMIGDEKLLFDKISWPGYQAFLWKLRELKRNSDGV